MENKAQNAASKTTKAKEKNGAKYAPVRVRMNSKKQASSLLEEANKKKFGRKIKFDDLFEMAISLVTPEHLKMLQETSLTNENRRDRLQQKWIELHGPLTHDEFVGLTMTAEFFEFIKEHGAEAVPA